MATPMGAWALLAQLSDDRRLPLPLLPTRRLLAELRARET
jgi:hypothetical protein